MIFRQKVGFPRPLAKENKTQDQGEGRVIKPMAQLNAMHNLRGARGSSRYQVHHLAQQMEKEST